MGNQTYYSFAIKSNDFQFIFMAPYSSNIDQTHSKLPHPAFDVEESRRFFKKHGLAVRAMGVLVEDVAQAFERSIDGDAIGVLEPSVLIDELSRGKFCILKVKLYRDVVLLRLDHVVCNVEVLEDAILYVAKFIGFHHFTKFTVEHVGTTKRKLNSMVLANTNEMVLLTMNEPMYGTKRKSQIQTYLERNEGPDL